MTTDDPHHPAYRDEKAVRDELTRVFDVCHSCKRCVGLCPSFPTLFDLVDGSGDHDAGRLTPADQDLVVDQCFQCKLCAVECPYTPGRHEWSIDFPRLMLRAVAMRRDAGQLPVRRRLTVNVLGRTEMFGRLGTSGAPVVSRAVAGKPGSFLRRWVSRMAGVSAERELTPFAAQRFSSWFSKHTSRLIGEPRARAVVFPTCLIEYQATDIGRALVDVYEHHGVECAVSGAGCCGAPWQHAGEVERFTAIAERNVRILASEIRAGGDVVVAQPTCGYVIRHDYVHYVDPSLRADAVLVAQGTRDAVEYLAHRQHIDGGPLGGPVAADPPTKVTYHVCGHLAANDIGYPARDLLESAGSAVQTVRQSSGNESLWELRSVNDSIASAWSDRLAAQIERAGGDVVVGDCQLSNAQTEARTGAPVAHPLQLIARVYGMGDGTPGPTP